MLRLSNRQDGLSRLALGFIALALLLRVLIPAGYMLSPAKAGDLPSLVICTSHGPLIIDQKDQKAPAKPYAANQSCAFAGAGGGGLATEPAVSLASPIVWTIARAIISLPIELGRRLAAPPPPTTGPPSSL